MRETELQTLLKPPGVQRAPWMKRGWNTEIVKRGPDGQACPVWNPNWAGRMLDRLLGWSFRFRPLGTWELSLRTHNLIVNRGHSGANGRMSNQGSYGVFTTLAIGIGTTAATISDTALGSESTTGGAARAVAATISQVQTNVANDTTQLVKTFVITATLAISEEGIFDTTTAPPSGNILAKQVFATINVSTGDWLELSLLAAKSAIQKVRELLGPLNPMPFALGMAISSQGNA